MYVVCIHFTLFTDFKKIHEKAFEKMESIEDYQKRIFNSAKKMGGLNLKVKKNFVHYCQIFPVSFSFSFIVRA